MIPVAHDPTLQCHVCRIVFDVLDMMLTSVRASPDLNDREIETHILGSVCAWWTANGLEKYDRNPLPLFAMFADILEQYGVDVETIQAMRADLVVRSGGVH